MARENAALTRHVKELWPDLEHLFEVGDQAQQLRVQPGWDVLCKVIDAEIDAINAQMESAATNVLDQAEYAVRHGRIGGLKAAREAREAVVSVAEERKAEQKKKHEGDAESSPER